MTSTIYSLEEKNGIKKYIDTGSKFEWSRETSLEDILTPGMCTDRHQVVLDPFPSAQKNALLIFFFYSVWCVAQGSISEFKSLFYKLLHVFLILPDKTPYFLKTSLLY